MRSQVWLGPPPPDGGLPRQEPAAPSPQPAYPAGVRSAPGLPGQEPAAPSPRLAYPAGVRSEGGWTTPRATLRTGGRDKERELLQLQEVVADCKAHHQQTLQLLGQLSTQNIDLRAQLDRAARDPANARPVSGQISRRRSGLALPPPPEDTLPAATLALEALRCQIWELEHKLREETRRGEAARAELELERQSGQPSAAAGGTPTQEAAALRRALQGLEDRCGLLSEEREQQMHECSQLEWAVRAHAAGSERCEAAFAEEAQQASALRAQLQSLRRAPSYRWPAGVASAGAAPSGSHGERQLAVRLHDLQREVDVARDSQGRSVEALEAARRESRGLRAALRAEEEHAREQAAALEMREEARAEVEMAHLATKHEVTGLQAALQREHVCAARCAHECQREAEAARAARAEAAAAEGALAAGASRQGEAQPELAAALSRLAEACVANAAMRGQLRAGSQPAPAPYSGASDLWRLAAAGPAPGTAAGGAPGSAQAGTEACAAASRVDAGAPTAPLAPTEAELLAGLMGAHDTVRSLKARLHEETERRSALVKHMCRRQDVSQAAAVEAVEAAAARELAARDERLQAAEEIAAERQEAAAEASQGELQTRYELHSAQRLLRRFEGAWQGLEEQAAGYRTELLVSARQHSEEIAASHNELEVLRARLQAQQATESPDQEEACLVGDLRGEVERLRGQNAAITSALQAEQSSASVLRCQLRELAAGRPGRLSLLGSTLNASVLSAELGDRHRRDSACSVRSYSPGRAGPERAEPTAKTPASSEAAPAGAPLADLDAGGCGRMPGSVLGDEGAASPQRRPLRRSPPPAHDGDAENVSPDRASQQPDAAEKSPPTGGGGAPLEGDFASPHAARGAGGASPLAASFAVSPATLTYSFDNSKIDNRSAPGSASPRPARIRREAHSPPVRRRAGPRLGAAGPSAPPSMSPPRGLRI